MIADVEKPMFMAVITRAHASSTDLGSHSYEEEHYFRRHINQSVEFFRFDVYLLLCLIFKMQR